MNKRIISFLQRLVFYFLVAFIAVYALFPFYWAFTTSFKTENEMFRRASYIPQEPTMKNYEYVIRDNKFFVALRNSAFVAGLTSVLSLLVGSFAA